MLGYRHLHNISTTLCRWKYLYQFGQPNFYTSQAIDRGHTTPDPCYYSIRGWPYFLVPGCQFMIGFPRSQTLYLGAGAIDSICSTLITPLVSNIINKRLFIRLFIIQKFNFIS